MIKKLILQIFRSLPELKALVKGELPGFIYSKKRCIENQIVVFAFHSINPILFEEQLRHIKNNKFNVITTCELHRYLSNSLPIPENTIMLTFDDCRASLWTTAYPLLRKFNMKGVAYLCPACIKSSTQKRTHFDAVNDRNYSDYVDSSFQPFASWEEIIEMHESGVIDFQGHTYYHEKVFVENSLCDFFNPEYRCNFSNLCIPVVRDNGAFNYERDLAYGTPIYKMEPVMKGSPRYLDDETLRRCCIEKVERLGGEAFFKKSEWRKILLAEFRKQIELNGNKGTYQSKQEMEDYIRRDLTKTREEIASKLRGKNVTSMCFPWEDAGNSAIKIAKETGYNSCVFGIIPGRITNTVEDDPYHICRLSGDFVKRLPGDGRISLAKLIYYKFWKRLNRLKTQKEAR